MKHCDRLSLFERLLVAYHAIGRHVPVISGLVDGPCWPWTGSRCNKGYGHMIRVAGRTMRVHIAAWELVKGRKVRAGYTLDHGCRNQACWRPSHMEEVTRAVNTARGNRANPRSTERAREGLRLKRTRVSPSVVVYTGPNEWGDEGTVNPVTSPAAPAR